MDIIEVALFILTAVMIFLGVACFSTALILRGMGFKLNTQNKVLTGVCSGVAQKIPCNPLWVRLGFVLANILAGYGAVLYLFLWLILSDANAHQESQSAPLAQA